MWHYLSGVFLGWALGANDTSNIFGAAVASRMIRFWTAAILCSVFVTLGALLQGEAGMRTYQALSPITDLDIAFIVSLAAAVTVTLMTYWKLPASTSQAMVGALVAMSMAQGRLEYAPLIKIAVCWVATPIAAMILAFGLYFVLGKLVNRLDLDLFSYDRSIRIALVVAGSYGAYSLGANAVANVSGAFSSDKFLGIRGACIMGALAISLGVLTYSRRVMMTVGKGLIKLDSFTAFVVVLSEALTVHVFAHIGVPVSISQAVVGGVLGIGLLSGMRTLDTRTFGLIAFGWLGTPLISFSLAAAFYFLR